jgi:hypothetical protein
MIVAFRRHTLALPRGRAGYLLPALAMDLEPVAFPWLDPPFRPRVAILLGRLSGAATQTGYPDLDEWAR